MAVKAATFETIGGGCRVITWSGLANGDTGEAVQMSAHPDKTVQLIGTLSVGGAMTLQGSNDNTNWFTLSDAGGTDILLTALDGVTVMESPLYIRPNITAGDGSTLLSVILVALDK